MKLEFQPPQVFQSGSEIGLVSWNIYNAVYNISDREPSNNELFLLCTDVNTAGDIPAVSTDSRLEIFTNVRNTNERLYKITFTNGVYDVEAVDLYVASLMNDFVNGSFIDYASRKIVISPDYSSGKFKKEFPSGKFDFVFRHD